jgi:N-glycosylase/DNA lyase
MSSGEKNVLVDEIMAIYSAIRRQVEQRLDIFRRIWETGDERELFTELAFCILTPQSGARRCGHALDLLVKTGLLFGGSSQEISREIGMVRFRNNKARYLAEARKRFIEDGESIREIHSSGGHDPHGTRRWMAAHVRGIGYKEASHFMRNIGIGEDLAILDRHVLRNMVKLGLIAELPAALSPARYHSIERLLGGFAAEIGIPMGHLDFVLWYRETGDIFK